MTNNIKTVIAAVRKEWQYIDDNHLIMLVVQQTGASYEQVEALL